MTRSPGANSVTPSPTLSITPENSPPGENGNGGLVWYLPAMISVSKKFKPTASTLATTSPGPATGSAMSPSSSSSGGPKRWQRIAFTGLLQTVGRRYTTVGDGIAPGKYHSFRLCIGVTVRRRARKPSPGSEDAVGFANFGIGQRPVIRL